jgi:hypothetical protein
MANNQGDIIVGVSLDSKKAQAQLQDFQNRFSKTKEITTKVTLKGGTEALKVVRQYEDAVNKTKISTQQLMNVDGTATQVRDKFGRIVSNCTEKITKYEQEISTANNSTKDFNYSMSNLGETFVKVAKFKIVTELLMAFINAGKQAIEIVKEFDKELTEFRKVSDLSGEALDEYTNKLGELGEAVASTTTEMISASSQFVKAGFTEEQSAELAQIAELYRNIADEELTAGESASFVISQMKAFGDESTAFAEHTINAVNNVSNQMAVSSTDITTALTKTSSAMSVLGNSYEQTIALTYNN